uniref:Uncharacterized protein n=1 Tax=Soybean thrips virus 1 TaxID=2796560 RepID=A0A7T3R0J1_9VIRU|nr:hypothetical protein [Soybean thrips virus 1]
MYFVDVVYDNVVEPLEHTAKEKEIGLIAMMLAVALASYLLWRITVVAPLIFHAFIIYHQGMILMSVFSIFTWLVALVRKMTTKNEKDKMLAPLYSYEHQYQRDSSYEIWHSYLILGVFLLISWSQNVYPDWRFHSGSSVFIAAMHLIKMVPGVGAHSTTGLIGMILLIFFAIYCSPSALEDTMMLARRMLSSPTQTIEVTPFIDVPVQVTSWGDRDWWRLPRLGISYSSFPDMIRFAVGHVPSFWVVLDDLYGPGLATTSIIDILVKKDLREKFIGSVRYSPMILFVLFEIIFYSFMADYVSLVLQFVSMTIVYVIWRFHAEPKWKERGAAATATSVRADAQIPRSDVENCRLYVTCICCILSGFCLVARMGGSTGWIVMFTFISTFYSERVGTGLLGLFTGNYLLILLSFIMRKPLTKSYRECTMAGSEDPTY